MGVGDKATDKVWLTAVQSGHELTKRDKIDRRDCFAAASLLFQGPIWNKAVRDLLGTFLEAVRELAPQGAWNFAPQGARILAPQWEKVQYVDW